MNVQSQRLILLFLTMTSGCVDAITFLSFGQVFAAAMTGNTVLFGLALVHGPGLHVSRYAMALGGFVCGNAIAALICYRIKSKSGWHPRLLWALLCEATLLGVVCALVDARAAISTNVLVLLLSAAMGSQGVIARRVGVNGITTTVITSTLTGLIETVVWRLREGGRPAVANNPSGSSGSMSVGVSSLLWVGAIVVYGLGAAICGRVEMHALRVAVWLPFGICLAVLFWSWVAYLSQSNHRMEQ